MDYLLKSTPRQEQLFSFDWEFHLGDLSPDNVWDNNFDFSPVQLPNDWSIRYPFYQNAPTRGSGGYVQAGIGWYRKTFTVSNNVLDKRLFLTFDGAYMCAEVWLNGHVLGSHVYGYTPFEFEVTHLIQFDAPNHVAVRIDNSAQPNSRWYTGSGITRDVWLKAVSPIHIPTYGVCIRTEVSNHDSSITVETTIAGNDVRPFLLTTQLTDFQGRVAAEETTQAFVGTVLQTLNIQNPFLWSPDCPNLYKAISVLTLDGVMYDYVETTFGIRTIDFNPRFGFMLNGKQIKLNGICIHHDGGCLGAAVPAKVWERRLKIMKEMGANAIRCSHNPPDPSLLDLCDSLGIMVMDEAFDEWNILKEKDYGSNTHASRGYSEWFEEHHEADLTIMLLRDRNHPSIILWSIGNEVPEQLHEEGHVTARRLKEICRNLDPTRLITQGCDQIAAEPKAATDDFLNELDVVGYNYVGRWRERAETFYDIDKYLHPDWCLIGTENGAACGRRSDYDFIGADASCLKYTYYSAPVVAGKLLRHTMVHDYIAGDFMWTGIDYLGEANWPNRSSDSGVLDTCGFPKDHYYFYQSIWMRKEPMVHVFPHWNLNLEPGTVIPVICYTNCDYAELFLNGKFYGRKSYGYPLYGMTEAYGHFEKPLPVLSTGDLFLSWDVPYEPGSLEVVCYRDNAEACRSTLTTSGAPAMLQVDIDTPALSANGRDIAHVVVRIVDDMWNLVPTASNRITITLSGQGKLLGIDNGKSDSHELFCGSTMKAFGGMLLAVVQAKREPGNITLSVSCEGLPDVSLSLEAVNK
jgi:beta-galactosidase